MLFQLIRSLTPVQRVAPRYLRRSARPASALLLVLLSCESGTEPPEPPRSDSIAPTVQFVYPGANQRLRSTIIGLHLEVADDSLLTSIRYSVNGGPEESTALPAAASKAISFYVTGRAGRNSIQVAAEDGAGNVTSRTLEVTVDPLPFNYEVVQLDLVGDSVRLIDRNERGQVLYSSLVGGLRRAFLFDGTTSVEIGEFMVPFDLNNSGEVVGVFTREAAGFHWKNGQLTSFGGFAPQAINDSGLMAGTGVCCTPVIRLRQGDQTWTLPAPAPNPDVTNINEAGTVLGHVSVGDPQIVIWKGGPGMRVDPYSSAARGLNAAGHIAGVTRIGGASAPIRAYLWEPAGGRKALGSLYPVDGEQAHPRSLGLDETWPQDLNESLEIVGSANRPDREWRGFIWVDGVLVDLSGQTIDGAVISSAVRIDSRGNVLATRRLQGRDIPVLLRKVAELK